MGFLFWVWGFGVFPFCLRHIPATRISLKLTFAACVFAKNSRCTPVSLIRFSRHDRGTGVGTGVAVGGLPDTADVSHCRYRGRCGRRWCRHSRGLTAKVRQPPISSPALRPFTAAQVVLDLSDLPTFSPSLSSSRTHLANDEAHALHKGHALSESTSVSLRPKQANCSALKIARVIWTQVTATAPHHLLTGRPQTQTGRGPRPKGQPRLSAHRNEKGGTKNRRLRRYHEMAQSLLVSLLAVQ